MEQMVMTNNACAQHFTKEVIIVIPMLLDGETEAQSCSNLPTLNLIVIPSVGVQSRAGNNSFLQRTKGWGKVINASQYLRSGYCGIMFLAWLQTSPSVHRTGMVRHSGQNVLGNMPSGTF